MRVEHSRKDPPQPRPHGAQDVGRAVALLVSPLHLGWSQSPGVGGGTRCLRGAGFPCAVRASPFSGLLWRIKNAFSHRHRG